MATHSSVLPEEFCGRGSLVGYSPQGRKESDTAKNTTFTFTLLERRLHTVEVKKTFVLTQTK